MDVISNPEIFMIFYLTLSKGQNMAEFKRNLDRLRNFFTHHPHSINETYPEHLRFASVTGLKLIGAGMACLIHSFCPFWFENTASTTIKAMQEEMDARKHHPENKNPPF